MASGSSIDASVGCSLLPNPICCGASGLTANSSSPTCTRVPSAVAFVDTRRLSLSAHTGAELAHRDTKTGTGVGQLTRIDTASELTDSPSSDGDRRKSLPTMPSLPNQYFMACRRTLKSCALQQPAGCVRVESHCMYVQNPPSQTHISAAVQHAAQLTAPENPALQGGVQEPAFALRKLQACVSNLRNCRAARPVPRWRDPSLKRGVMFSSLTAQHRARRRSVSRRRSTSENEPNQGSGVWFCGDGHAPEVSPFSDCCCCVQRLPNGQQLR
jgi:hypothetical protein